MRRATVNTRRYLALSITILILLLASAGCSGGSTPQVNGSVPTSAPSLPPGSKAPTNGLVQTSTGGGVTISVEWRGLRGGSLIFGVSMDTHSGSVDQYNLRELAILRDSEGREYRPSSWDAPPGGHHRQGILTFPVADSLNLGTAKYVELMVKDTAGVKERDLRWQLG